MMDSSVHFAAPSSFWVIPLKSSVAKPIRKISRKLVIGRPRVHRFFFARYYTQYLAFICQPIPRNQCSDMQLQRRPHYIQALHVGGKIVSTLTKFDRLSYW